MPNPSVSIRLAIAGQAQVQAGFDAVGKTGQASLKIVETATNAVTAATERLDSANKAATDRILKRNQALAAAARAAQEADRVQAGLNSSYGIGTARPSARDSASAFEAAYAEQSKVQAYAAQQSQARAAVVRNNVQALFAPSQTRDRGADIAAYGKELDGLRAKYNPLFAAQQSYKAQLTEIRNAAKAGALTQRESSEAINSTKKAFVDQVEAIHRSTEANGINRNQFQEFGHVLRSVFDQLEAGVPLTQALSVEGGRLVQAFTEGKGGPLQTLKNIGTGLAGLITPMRLLIGTTALVGATAVLAYAQYEGAQDRLRTSLLGLGRQAGVTTAQLSDVARAGASAAGISYRSGVELAAGFASQGIGAGVTRQAIGYTPAFARATGQDQDTAGDQLAKALASPAQGAADLNRSLGFLDARVKTNIDDLVAQGRLDDARQTLSEALNETLKDSAEQTSRFGKAVEYAKNILPALGKAIAGAVDKESDQDKLTRLLGERSRATAGGTALGRFFTSTKSATGQDAEIAELQRKIAADNATNAAAAATAKRTADNNALTLQATDVIRGVLPDIVRAQTASNNIAILQSVLSNPDVLKNLGVSSAQASDALRNTITLNDNADPDRRAAQDQALAIKGLGDYTIAERAATEARRAALQVLRDTGDTIRANTAAENARNLIIEKANQEASDRADLAEQNLKLVGLNPYQRGLQEIENKYSGVGGYDKDQATARQLADSLKPAKDAIAEAGNRFLDKVTEAAEKVAAAAMNLGGPKMGTPGNLPFFASGPGKATPEMISDAAARTGVPAGLIAAIGTVENGGRLQGGTTMLGSNGRPSSAYGFGQLTNGAAADVANAVPGFSKYNPNTAVFGAAEYLKILLNRNNGSYDAALKAYGGTADYPAKIARVMGKGSLPATDASNDNTRALTTAADNARSKKAEIAGYEKEQYDAPLTAANQSVKDQIALLNVQKSTLGQTADQIKGAVAAQNLLNQYNDRGVPTTAALTAGVKAYGDSVAEAAAEQTKFEAQQKKLVDGLDSVRDAASEGLGTIVQGLRSGESAGKILQSVFDGLLSKVLSFAENSLIDGLFGAKGSTGGGLFGGGLASTLSGLFGGGGGVTALAGISGVGHNASGTTDWMGGLTEVGESGPEIINAPQHSQIIPNSVAFGRSMPPPAKSTGPLIQLINNHPSAGFEQKESRGPDGQDIIQVHVENALIRSAQTNSRGFRTFAARATSRVG